MTLYMLSSVLGVGNDKIMFYQCEQCAFAYLPRRWHQEWLLWCVIQMDQGKFQQRMSIEWCKNLKEWDDLILSSKYSYCIPCSCLTQLLYICPAKRAPPAKL